MRDHGRSRADHRFFTTDEIGYKYRMSSLQAAFGRAQLARIDELVDKKRRIFGWYEERLIDIPGIRLNFEPPAVTNTFWMVTLVVDRFLPAVDHRHDAPFRPARRSTPAHSFRP